MRPQGGRLLPVAVEASRGTVVWWSDLLAAVFQLGIICLRVLCPARTVLFIAPCPNYLFKQKLIEKTKILNLKNVIAVYVFSDSRCRNACKCLQICAHVFVNRSQNCAETSFHSSAGLCPILCFVCALNCAGILVVRGLDCAQFFCTLPFSQPSWNTEVLGHHFSNLSIHKLVRIKYLFENE